MLGKALHGARHVDVHGLMVLVRNESYIDDANITDMVGAACAQYRCDVPWIRLPTTLIGLVNPSIARWLPPHSLDIYMVSRGSYCRRS